MESRTFLGGGGIAPGHEQGVNVSHNYKPVASYAFSEFMHEVIVVCELVLWWAVYTSHVEALVLLWSGMTSLKVCSTMVSSILVLALQLFSGEVWRFLGLG